MKILQAKVLVDVEEGVLVSNPRIVIDKDKIISVKSGWDVVPGNDNEIINLSKMYILPGLINSHAHCSFLSDGATMDEHIGFSPQLMTLIAQKNASTELNSGVTTVRDCGDVPGVMAAVRQGIEKNVIRGPRLFLSGQALTRTGGHFHQFSKEVDGPDEIVKAARQNFKDGADFIKCMVTGGGTPGTYPGYASLSYGEVKAVVDDAHTIGKTVTAHARGTAGMVVAVDAGIDHLEHCVFEDPHGNLIFDAELADSIAEKGIYVTPTVQLHRDKLETCIRQKEAGDNSAELQNQIDILNRTWDKRLEIFRDLLNAGVTMVAGNDAGLPLTGFGLLWRELESMVMGGMTSMQAIRAATKTAAAATKLDTCTGSLKPGMAADIIAVKDNPIEEITALAHVAFVMVKGEVFVGKEY